MHIFLQGPKNIGKSTVIYKTLGILAQRKPLVLGGFFTWNGGKDDLRVYMRSARSDDEREIFCLASWDAEIGRLVCDNQVFEETGTRMLEQCEDADLIIMDELGYLESGAFIFRKAVMDALARDLPILGVLRLGDIPWHAEIKRNPTVTLIDVSNENRDVLPRALAERFVSWEHGNRNINT